MEKDKPDPLVGEIEELMMMTTASMQHGSWLVDALPLCEPYLRVQQQDYNVEGCVSGH